MPHFCISPLLQALLQFKDFTRSVIGKVELRFSFQQLACSQPIRLPDNATLHPNTTCMHRHMQPHTMYTSMLDRKRKWLFSIWRATNKRCCRPILDSSLLKEPLCLWIWRWGFKKEGEEVGGGGNGRGKRSESEKIGRDSVSLRRFSRLLCGLRLDLSHWI